MEIENEDEQEVAGMDIPAASSNIAAEVPYIPDDQEEYEGMQDYSSSSAFPWRNVRVPRKKMRRDPSASIVRSPGSQRRGDGASRRHRSDASKSRSRSP